MNTIHTAPVPIVVVYTKLVIYTYFHTFAHKSCIKVSDLHTAAVQLCCHGSLSIAIKHRSLLQITSMMLTVAAMFSLHAALTNTEVWHRRLLQT